ncbi:MAG TPA: site-specific DNA-methyltransferase [Draconibacterium sp.]|nr:site-specific DNA-methyltransferase [Draconibacterium sp.]
MLIDSTKNTGEKTMDGKSLNITEDLISKLKEIIPGVFSENKLNIEQFKRLLGENADVNSEHFQLSWAGKNEAYRTLQTPSTSTLCHDLKLSENWETTKNLFIEGENLEVLKVLQKSYFGKIKMITIDPPYNTGNDSFIYPDKFAETKAEYLKRLGDKDVAGYLIKEGLFKSNKKENGHFHSNWLSMMLPRLFIARNLLREDGVLFVSIDDNEAYTLKLLLDEIFGEENFLGNIIWNSTKSVTNTALLSVSHTHNLVYFKNLEYHKKNRFEFRLPDTPAGFENPDNDPRGPWKADPFQVEGERPNQLYKITNPKTGNEYVPNPGCSWKNDYNKFQELLADNRIVFGSTGEAGPQRKRFWSEAKERGRVAKSLWIDVDTTSNATSYLESLVGKKVFTNPKPVDLIQRFIQLGTYNENDIVLDFFGGSGTTAEAVLKQNLADNKKRSFIFVTLPEIIDDTTQAGKNAKSLGCETISEVARLRIVKAIEKIKKENNPAKTVKQETDLSKQDLGFKFFSCTASNFKIWRSDEIKNKADLLKQISFFDKAEKDGANELDIVFEIIIKNGLDLNSKIDKIEIGELYFYNINSFSLLIATNGMNIESARQLLRFQPKTIICLDSHFKNQDSLKTNLQLLFEDSGITFKTI